MSYVLVATPWTVVFLTEFRPPLIVYKTYSTSRIQYSKRVHCQINFHETEMWESVSECHQIYVNTWMLNTEHPFYRVTDTKTKDDYFECYNHVLCYKLNHSDKCDKKKTAFYIKNAYDEWAPFSFQPSEYNFWNIFLKIPKMWLCTETTILLLEIRLTVQIVFSMIPEARDLRTECMRDCYTIIIRFPW